MDTIPPTPELGFTDETPVSAQPRSPTIFDHYPEYGRTYPPSHKPAREYPWKVLETLPDREPDGTPIQYSVKFGKCGTYITQYNSKANRKKKCTCNYLDSVSPSCPKSKNSKHHIKDAGLRKTHSVQLSEAFLLATPILTYLTDFDNSFRSWFGYGLLIILFLVGIDALVSSMIHLFPGMCHQSLFAVDERHSFLFSRFSVKPSNPFALTRYPRVSDLARYLPHGCTLPITYGKVAHFPGPNRIKCYKLLHHRSVAGLEDQLISMFKLMENTIHAEALTSSIAERHTKLTDEILLANPFTLDPDETELLQRAGLSVTSLPGKAHSHAAHKRIEDEFLYRILPHILTGHTRMTVLFQKERKTKHMLEFPLRSLELFNPSLTADDAVRFGRYLPALPTHINGDVLFLHDVGHFLRPTDVAMMFRLYPSLEKIAFTGVMPAELYSKHAGFWPHLYRLSYHTDHYTYYLGPDYKESYQHPYNSNEWLELKSIGGANGEIHSVCLYQSVYAHRLFYVTRGSAPLESNYRDVAVPDLLELPADNSIALHNRLIRKSLYDSTLIHSRHLKTLGSYDQTMAKIRQEFDKKDLRLETNRCLDYASEMVPILHGIRGKPPLILASAYDRYCNTYRVHLKFETVGQFIHSTMPLILFMIWYASTPSTVRELFRPLHPDLLASSVPSVGHLTDGLAWLGMSLIILSFPVQLRYGKWFLFSWAAILLRALGGGLIYMAFTIRVNWGRIPMPMPDPNGPSLPPVDEILPAVHLSAVFLTYLKSLISDPQTYYNSLPKLVDDVGKILIWFSLGFLLLTHLQNLASPLFSVDAFNSAVLNRFFEPHSL